MTKRAAHYNPRIAREICEAIAEGDTLEEALEKIGFLAPTLTTVYRWFELYPEFKEKYETARTLQADVHADRMLMMSREVLSKPTAATAYRVAVDILKWQAEVRNSGRYGKRIDESGKKKPMDPAKLRAEIKRLEAELGVAEKKVVPLKAVKASDAG
jgi:hypothetical protein